MNINFLLNNTLSTDIGIDIGTETTLIYIAGQGLVLKEPSYIAYDHCSENIAAVGTQAKEMLGKAPQCVKIVKPIANGVISDRDMACKMISRFISSICQKTILKPRVIASVSMDSTQVEQRALCDVLKDAGARDVFLIEEPLAAAAGAGCDISLARGMLIADIGAGSCDVASISLGSAVIGKSITTAGDSFTLEIIKYMKSSYNLEIGILTAEKIKNQIGCAYPFETIQSMSVYGSDITSGLPRSANVSSEEIREILTPLLYRISDIIKTTLEDTPPELQSDILEDGILLTGGGAKLHGIDRWLRMEMGIKVFVTENMEECVINGIGAELSKLDLPGSQTAKYYYSL